MLHENAKNWRGAIKGWTACLQIKEDPEFYLKRGHCYKKIDHYIEACDDLQAAADMKPYPEASISNKSLYTTLIYYYRKLGIDLN